MRTTRSHAATLARFHGYISDNFKWEDSSYARNVMSEVAERKLMLATDTDGKTVNQQNAILGPDQLDRLYKWALTQSADTCALLLAFCSIVSQTLARSEQLCKMNSVHMSIYPEAAPYKLPLAGPAKFLHLGDRGHHKVNKSDDMAHWVMRTLEPSLACPWFGLALKAVGEGEGEGRYIDIQQETTGMHAGQADFTTHTSWQKTDSPCACSGHKAKGCQDQEEGGCQDQIQDGPTALWHASAADR